MYHDQNYSSQHILNTYVILFHETASVLNGCLVFVFIFFFLLKNKGRKRQVVYFIGPRCKDTKDTELPCLLATPNPNIPCGFIWLFFCSSSFLTVIEEWSFPPAVSSRNNTATDFQALLREEPRAMMPRNSMAVFPISHKT